MKKESESQETNNVQPKNDHSVQNNFRLISNFGIIKKSVKNDQYRDTLENWFWFFISRINLSSKTKHSSWDWL